MKLEKFTMNSKYLIKSINLEDIDKSKLSSLGVEEGIEIIFYKKSIFGYPVAFFINNRIITLDKKILKNIELEKINNDKKQKLKK